jgi:outer membrane protease
MNNSEQNPQCVQAVVSSRFIYLITNETDMTVESAWSNFEEAKKECQQWEKMKPQKEFMVVELPINGG